MTSEKDKIISKVYYDTAGYGSDQLQQLWQMLRHMVQALPMLM